MDPTELAHKTLLILYSNCVGDKMRQYLGPLHSWDYKMSGLGDESQKPALAF